MLFPKVDVRENLLGSGTMGGARITEQVEIHLDDAHRSERSLLSLVRGQNAMRLYKVDVARVGYCDGITFAREDDDDLLAAAGITLQAQLMDGMSPAGPLTSLTEARDLLNRDIAAMQETLTDQRAKRDQALIVMQPRMDLLDLLEHNITQYELQRDANFLRDAKRFADQQLVQRHPETALQIAKTAWESAKNLFGETHWLCAVMNVRCALALHMLGRHTEVAKLAKTVIAQFEEWSTSAPEVDSVFLVDCTLMQQAAAGQLVFGS
jgi:hypothetical protein